jgi:hypothetical protein
MQRDPLMSLCCAPLLALAASMAHAEDADQLAKQLSNPIASLISVPFQFNHDEGIGPDGDGSRTLVNVQPVIPVSVGEEWNMISRTILPIVYQDDIGPGTGSQFGAGDTMQSLFFSPKSLTDSGWTWGVGPVFYLPTASDDLLGADKWGAGPTAVALKQTASGWTYGALVNHIWSFAGDDDRADINNTFLQPFLSKGLGKGRTLSVNLESTYDWNAAQWTVPVNVTYSKVTKVGSQLVSVQGGIRSYLRSPESAADWGLRFTVTLLYPK